MNHNCNGDCFSNYNKDEDNFVIQRLQDIISICEFLIKHEENSNKKESLEEIFDRIENEEKKDNNKKNEKDYTYYINRYKTDPIWIVPYYHNYPWWNNVRF